MEKKYRLAIYTVNRRCIDSEGEWDGTWDTSYEWVILNMDGEIVDSMDGFNTHDGARSAGEAVLKKMEDNL